MFAAAGDKLRFEFGRPSPSVEASIPLRSLAFEIYGQNWPRCGYLDIRHLISLGAIYLRRLAASGSWEDVKGSGYWLPKRLKPQAAIFLFVVLHVAQVVGSLITKDTFLYNTQTPLYLIFLVLHILLLLLFFASTSHVLQKEGIHTSPGRAGGTAESSRRRPHTSPFLCLKKNYHPQFIVACPDSHFTKRSLHGVSFSVNSQGASITLVSEFGLGALAILRLLYPVDDLEVGDDRILVGGHSDVTPPNFRNAIGAQDDLLFGGSKGYNINYVTFWATQDGSDEATHAAQIHVHNNGIRPSGGEKQQVATACPVLKDIEEATSAPNTSAERDIQTILQNSIRGHSIAHRPSILGLKYGQIIECGKHKQLLGSFTDQSNMIGGLPASGAVMELVCMYQIDDTAPGAFEGPTTQDIDATPPQDTGDSLAAASAALVAETSTPAQATGQSAPSLGVPVVGTGTQVVGHPVAFSTADFAPVGFQGGSSEVRTPGSRSSPDPSCYAEFHQQAQETSDSPGRAASGFIPAILNLGNLRRGTSSASRSAPVPTQSSTGSNAVAAVPILVRVLRGVRLFFRNMKRRTNNEGTKRS